MTMLAFTPYHQGNESIEIADLTIENQVDVVNIYGNIQLSKDQQGLVYAKQLQQLMNAIVTQLEQEQQLPAQVECVEKKWVENPFL